MRAAVLHAAKQPLRLEEVPAPKPGAGELLIRVKACAVCRTDLHLADGELAAPKLPLILGHEIAGVVEAGEGFPPGTRVGVPWLGGTCGRCSFCLRGAENLCSHASFTGYTRDGGFAEYAVADARYCFRLPEGVDDAHAGPLLCAGLIGYRSLKMCGDASRLGLYGFGAAAHLVTQLARWQGRKVFALTRPGDGTAQAFARELGASWVGGSDQAPPEPLDAAILFAPAGELVPRALAAVRPGGTVVCGGIHMSDLPSFPYSLLWGERTLRSVANLTRADAIEFLPLAAKAKVRTTVKTYPLGEANQALDDLRRGQLTGAAVLLP